MNKKIVQGLAIAALSIVSIVFLVQGKLDLAVLFMTLLFVLTNSFRYRQMKERGMEKEAKWMKGMAILFAVMFAVVLMTILM